MVEKYCTRKALIKSAARLQKVLDLEAPEVIIFNEFKLLEMKFNDWCQEHNLDPKEVWIPPNNKKFM